jgi:hypothetical protein
MPAQTLAKRTHLLNRDGRYWARLSVPVALRSIVNKRELLESLGPDRTEALRKLPGAVGRMHDVLVAARADQKPASKPMVPTTRGRILSLRNLAGAHYDSEIAIDDAERSFDPADLPSNNAVRYQPAYEVMLRNVASGRFSDAEALAAVGWAIEGFQARGNTKAVSGTPEWRELARTLAAIHLETFSQKAARDQGDFAQERKHPLLQPPKAAPDDPLKVRIIRPDSERTLGDLAEQFATEKATSDRTRHDNRVTIRMFEEQLGEPLPIYRLTRQHVHGFKRALADAPANYTKRFPGMTLPEAIKANKARTKPYPLLNPRTINDKYLARLHAFLNWALRGDIVPDNPSAGIKVDVVKDRNPRPPSAPS